MIMIIVVLNIIGEPTSSYACMNKLTDVCDKHHTTHNASTNTRKKRTRMKPENQTKVSNKKIYRNS